MKPRWAVSWYDVVGGDTETEYFKAEPEARKAAQERREELFGDHWVKEGGTPRYTNVRLWKEVLSREPEPKPRVYVDKLRPYGKKGKLWAHLWADTREALDYFAAVEVDLDPDWFQDREGFPHYDVTESKYRKALKAGAVKMSIRDWLRAQRRKS